MEVPFPSSPDFAALTNADFDKNITEFSVCYRILIESYNDGCINIVWGKLEEANDKLWDSRNYRNNLCKDIGWTMDGFQESSLVLHRNIPEGGLDNKSWPFIHHINLPRNIDTSQWVSFCSSYSSILHKIHQYQDELKVFSYTYIDEVEDPMPSDTFKNLLIGKNLRGLLTDLNIYSSFFDDAAMIAWTKGCAQKKGDIFAWDPTKLNTTIGEDITKNVTIVSIDKKVICMDPNIKRKHQETVLSGSEIEEKRFKPKPQEQPLTESVLELITDPLNTRNAFQAVDVCFRLNGELMPRP